MPRWTRLLQRPFDALELALPEALRGDADAVHEARVASRRVREGLAILAEGPGQDRATKLIRRFRKVTRALGRVRELDVAVDLVTHLVPDDHPLAQDRYEIASALMARRTQELVASTDRVDSEGTANLRGSVDSDIVDLWRSGWDWHASASAHLDRRARGLLVAIERTRVLYEPGRLHVARIALKRFRYAVELVAAGKGRSARRAIAALKAGQDVLGRMHDLHVLAEYVRADTNRSSGRAQLLSLIEKEIRLEHARYLTLRAPLTEVVGECVRRFCG